MSRERGDLCYGTDGSYMAAKRGEEALRSSYGKSNIVCLHQKTQKQDVYCTIGLLGIYAPRTNGVPSEWKV